MGLFILGVVGFPLSLLVIAFRLKYMLMFQDVRISTWESIKLTFMGHFFNSVIPGMVGGDLVKAWYLFRPDRRVGVIVVTVLVDRLLGLCEMVILSAAMVAIVLGLGLETIERMHTPLISVSVLVTAVIMALAFLLSRRLRKLFRLEKIYGRTSIAHHFSAAGKAAGIYREKPFILVGGLLITIVAHVFFIGAIAMVGFSLGVDVSWYNYLVYIPLIYIIGSVPVTPGGMGLIENLYLGFLAGATISPSADLSSIIALAILVRFLLMAWGLPGLPVAIAGRKLPSAEELEEEIHRAELAEENEALEKE